MSKKENALVVIGTKAWDFRRVHGLSKSLPAELQAEVVDLANSGITSYSIAKAIGVTGKTVRNWVQSADLKNEKFAEAVVVDHSNTSKIEIKLSIVIQNCRVELYGCDYSLLRRLVRKMDQTC
jgi:transposase